MDSHLSEPVLITGASTGIGRKITELLSSKGHMVYAGARKQEDLDSLNQLPYVKSVKLDVSRKDDIDNLLSFIESEGNGLFAVINNAGVGDFGPLIEFNEENFDFLMNVNLYGPFRITKAVSDYIIKSKGRIITTGSIAGIVSTKFMGPYSMSKHAIEAYSDTLRLELDKFDVQVILIEPGNYDSAISQSAINRSRQRPNFSATTKYLDELQELKQQATSRPGDRSNFKPPDEVADAIYDALTNPHPKRRYMVVPNLEEANATISKAMAELVQLNENQTYSFSKDELLAKLNNFMTNGIPADLEDYNI